MLERKHLESAFTYKSGRPPEDLLKEKNIKKIYPLASNENYLGPSKKAIEAIINYSKDIHLYPDTICSSLKEKLSKKFELPQENIIIGAGSSEIISMLYTAFVELDETILMPNPSFMLYKVLAKFMNLNIESYDLNEDFTYNIDEIIAKNKPKTKIIVVVSPNNPTGTIITKNQLERLLTNLRDDQILCLDEAYIEFNDSKEHYGNLIPRINEKNIVLIRTFSKIYALAGMRVGYAFAKKQIIDSLLKVLKPFTISSLTEQAAIASLDDDEFVNNTINLVKEAKRFVYDELDKMNIDYVKGFGNFVFIKTQDVETITQNLLNLGIVVRPTKQFGYEQAIRITYGDFEANSAFINALKENLKYISLKN
ncbi:MAG: histidinol-phosphate transaminase [Spirochaetales bacterium]|jgi:histidinol-phosphate aminotransferase|nr:histidinol-phosphate transaminase [Exilispira sp.]NMC67825.1 histidinol-phosphate transaminase [Spirochaetales bacterium]